MSKKPSNDSAKAADKGLTSLSQLENLENKDNQRNLTGSLEQCKEELRDAYMSFKDLQTRCVIDINRKKQENDDNQVYYFKPETFLLDDPEKQRQYRSELLKKVGQIPKPEPITYLGDDLHRNMCQAVADRSSAKITKANLAEYFKRRQYALQHMKYKLLCRWAHHNLSSESQENMGTEATFIYGKLEYNLEQAVNRQERLDQEDNYDKAKPELRPRTKSKEPGGSSLYVEKFDLKPQSLIREDDIEVYIRGVAHKNKLNKTVNKFISRLKWLPMLHKQTIYEGAVTGFYNQKQKSIDRQWEFVQAVRDRCQKTNVMTSDLNNELDRICEQYYCHRYKEMHLNTIDRILHQWKPNHDEVPGLIVDPFGLKIKILEASSQFGLTGDIELDQGFSFSYQVTVFFPTYFQKQVLKSQFSIYDAHEDDPNNVKKRTLNSMARIDTNIFRDVSTTKHTVPSDEAIHSELKNVHIKIMRVKSAAHFLDYIVLQPTQPDWHHKQEALLNNDNPVDNLLKSGFNFLDVNDLATINRINEDNTQLHLKNLSKMQVHNPHNQITVKNIETSDGNKQINIDKMPWKDAKSTAANIEAHLLHAVENPGDDDQTARQKPRPKFNSLAQIAPHLLTSYYTLRYVKSRDAKTRILYTLNYFRVIQKRLALDLREFTSRDRLDSHFVNPFVQSKEANAIIVNQTNYKTKAVEKRQKDDQKDIEQAMAYPKMTIFDDEQIEKMKNMASVRSYKLNGLFNNQILNTCPSYPKYHASHGEPITKLPQFEEQDKKPFERLEGSAIRLMGRVETIEINDKEKEVYVKDDFGIYIIFDCVLQDMKYLEDELIKIGSLFLKKSELLLDPTDQQMGQRPFPGRDRLEIINDLLVREADFQFNKVKLCQVYMECYEHITDPLEQQKIMQNITDIMARRPRLNLNANYFLDAYDAEINLLEKQFEHAQMLVDLQVTLEKTENKRLQDSLNMSYLLVNQYQANKWRYQDAEKLLSCLKTQQEAALANATQRESDVIPEQDIEYERSQANASHQKLEKKQTPTVEKHATPSVQSLKAPSNASETKQSSQGKKKSNLNLWGVDDSTTSVDLDNDEFMEDEQCKFSKLLGLPQITLETLYSQYSEKNHNVLKLMQEHSHFIAIHEGYPEFLTRLTHRSISDKNKEFQPNYWSQSTGSLDFYESLDFINRFYAVTQGMQQELYDTIKIWDPIMMTHIDTQVVEQSIKELQRVISFQEGAKVEYEGRALVEDEQVLGNSDKMIFYAKEMLAELTKKPKQIVDPFLIAKLDNCTINNFDWPVLPVTVNKYTLQRKGVYGFDYLMRAEKNAITGIAQSKAAEKTFTAHLSEVLTGKVTDTMNVRNIIVPSQLSVYCNMMELSRLRNELILAASETQILSEVYLQQCEIVGLKMSKLVSAEGISFEDNDQTEQDSKFVNFFDHGPSHMEKIGLAIAEFDPALLSNLNFRNPDSFKLNVLSAGLEEVRAILQYQLLQKHLLIVATRLNNLVMDSHQKAQSELELIASKKMAVPNSVIRYQRIINRHTDTINMNEIKTVRSTYKLSLSSNCQPLFYNIMQKKSSQRGSIAKEFSNYRTTVETAMPDSEHQCARIMRNFKCKLLTRFVQTVSTEVYLDSQRIQAVQSCQRLRMYNRLFDYDSKELGFQEEASFGLKYETSPLIENFPSNYLPNQFVQDEKNKGIDAKKAEDYKILAAQSGEILDHYGIPSSSTILGAESSPIEDLRVFKQKRFDNRQKVLGFELNDDLKDNRGRAEDHELHLKQMLPTFTPDMNFESVQYKKLSEEAEQAAKKKVGQSGGGLLDYEEALYFGDSKYSALTRYYQSLERIIQIEWFLIKVQFAPDQMIQLDNAIESGLLFWKLDDFDQRIADEVNPEKEAKNKQAKRSRKFYYDTILSMRKRRNMAEVVQTLGLTLKSFTKQYLKTKEENRFEYLTQYTEFRFQQVIGSLYKLMNQYYYQSNIEAAQILRQSISQLTKMGHVKVGFMQPNNYSVNSTITQHSQYSLEAGNFISGSIMQDEIMNFKRCVQPVINEKALEPPQVTLFQALYQQDCLRRSYPSQFAGQFCSTNGSVPFKAMEYALLALKPDERVYASSYMGQTKNQANDFMETVFNDKSMAYQSREDVYSLSQLLDAKKFINETASAILLRNALICWYENRPLPDTAEQYERSERNFKQNFFWKQLDQKEELTKKLNISGQYGQIPSKQQLEVLKNKIDNHTNDHSLATQSAIEARDKIVKALREEFAALKKKVTLDAYFNMKAEINVFSNEIEKFMIRASVKTLDAECNSLAKCFTLTEPKIQYHIHPFQQFAATFFDHCDPNLHLDVSNKFAAVQGLLTKMRNYSTEVETLTAGPGMVFVMKDINDILQEFCRRCIKDQEIAFKSRTEDYKMALEREQFTIYQKDQEIKTLKHRIYNIGLNLENIIDARLFEKGNQLIYELDSSNRILRLFKNSFGELESHLLEKIQGEQMQKFKRQNNEIQLKNEKFKVYQESILNNINADWEKNADHIKTTLKQKADQAKITDSKLLMHKRAPDYPGALGQSSGGAPSGSDLVTQVPGLPGAVVPEGFKHYPKCDCYLPPSHHPRPTLDLAGKEMLTEREAREELVKCCNLINSQRVFYRIKELLMMTKYQNEINNLKKQLNSNGSLWEQLAESEKRERVMKQELLYTQQSLSSSEKTIVSLKEEIKSIDAERVRLLNFKTSQYERLKELEVKCKKYDLSENLDLDKMMIALQHKDNKVEEMKSTLKVNQSLFDANEQRRSLEINKLKTNFRVEQQRTQQMIDKMEQMKLEIKMLESNDTQVAGIWKKKCLDLFDVCNQMKTENEELRERCKELISQGIELADAVGRSDNQNHASQQSRLSSVNVLPNLSKNDSQLKNTKYTASTHTKDTNKTTHLLQQNQPRFSDSTSKIVGFNNELGETQQAWMGQTFDGISKKIPQTQQRNRTVIPSLDYQTSTHAQKPGTKGHNPQDIKSILGGAPVNQSTDQRKRFGSIDPIQSSLNSSQVIRRRYHQDSLMNSSQYTNAIGQQYQSIHENVKPKVETFFKKPNNSIAFDLKGTAFQSHMPFASPRTRYIQKKNSKVQGGRHEMKESSQQHNHATPERYNQDQHEQNMDENEATTIIALNQQVGSLVGTNAVNHGNHGQDEGRSAEVLTPVKVGKYGQANNQLSGSLGSTVIVGNQQKSMDTE